MAKVLISFSGGMDSATLVGEAVSLGHETRLVSFTYGSKHNQWENRAADDVARHYRLLKPKLIDLSTVMKDFKSDLLKTGGSIPEGHYEAESMKATVVPCRNAIFSSILAGLADSSGYEEIWLGIHAGDRAIYPDCRPKFYHAMRDAISEATGGRVKFFAPYLLEDKTSILRRGIPLGVPYQITRTCYKDSPVACGRCGSCQERLAAFFNLGLTDPAVYESRELIPA
jgi:7-cyano-7-deazaguanine synthase